MTCFVNLYIASGRLNGFYTLRVARTSGKFCTDMYLRNLSTDADTAEKKAKEYFDRVYAGQTNVRFDGFADFDLSPWGSVAPWERTQIADVEAGIWPFGKNSGKKIADSDDGYVFYWAKQVGSSNVAAMLVEKCKEIAETRGLYAVEREKIAKREEQTNVSKGETNHGSNWQAHMFALAEKAADELRCTCKAIYDLGEELEDAANETAFCSRLDKLVFECTSCNWWFEQSEMAEDCGEEWICQECFDEGNNE